MRLVDQVCFAPDYASHLPDFPIRRPLPKAQHRDRTANELLAEMIEELTRFLKPQAALAIWHEEHHDPACLFRAGACAAGSHTEHLILEVAAQASRQLEGQQAVSVVDRGLALHGDILTAAIPSQGGIFTLGVVPSRLTGERFSLRHCARFERQLSILQLCVEQWAANRELVTCVGKLSSAIDHSGVATFLVEEDARILYANSLASRMIAQGEGITCKADKLSGATLADTLRLHAAVEHVCFQSSAMERTSPVLAFTRQRRRPLILSIAPVQDRNVEYPAVAIYVFDPEQELTALIEPACKLYGLSPSESRLACRLAGGMTLAETAIALGIQKETARSYLKQIFLKTETNRQVELVWLLLKSCVSTFCSERKQVF